MPYFTRRSYAEMLQPAAAPALPPDMLALARNILSAERDGAGQGPFRLRAPLRPGEQGRMVLDLSLVKGSEPLSLHLAPGDLVGPGGRIRAEAVRIDPAGVTLRPGAPAEVTVTIVAPAEAPPGCYAGALAASGGESFQIPIEAEIR
jgi:hypothetical protein